MAALIWNEGQPRNVHGRASEFLPLLVQPNAGQSSMRDCVDAMVDCARRSLSAWGAILFRGFAPPEAAEMRAVVTAFGEPLAPYDFASTPRTEIVPGIYSSTEYAREREIPLHNEQSYTRTWPLKIWFLCVQPAESGGSTPLADSRLVYASLDPALRKRFTDRGLLYVRNYSKRLDLPWQRVFGTSEPAVVEAYCRAHGIECEWKSDGGLRTRQRCQAVERHPRTGELIWFNQAHLFHLSALDVELREGLVDLVGFEGVPRNVYYGDGSPIEDSVMDEIRGSYASHRRSFAWQAGDLLLLDNMLIAHGRDSFRGTRSVLVAMTGTVDVAPSQLGSSALGEQA